MPPGMDDTMMGPSNGNNYKTSGSGTGTGTGPGPGPGPGMITGTDSGTTIRHLIPGAIAYRRKHQAIWKDLSIKADHIFKRINNAYQSPL